MNTQTQESFEVGTSGTAPLPKIRYESYQWQGLSDDEIQNIADETDKVFATSIFWVNAFARAIEQVLKEKNIC